VIENIVGAHGQEHPTDIASAAIAMASIPIYRCFNCERILVFWNGTAVPYAAYRLERREGDERRDEPLQQ
jgi:hypothetical protein